MADQENGSGQPEQTQAQTGEVPQVAGQEVPQANPGQHEGFQKRIDQITAQKHDALRQAEMYQQMLMEKEAQLTAALSQMGRPQHQEPLPDPLADLSPEDRRRIEAAVKTYVAPLESRLKQNDEYIAFQQQQMQQFAFEQQAAKESPEVVELAKKRLDQWQRKGLKGFVMADALIYARGELGASAPAAPARNAQGQFTAQPAPTNVTMSQTAPPPSATRAVQGPPANFEALPLEKKLEYWAKTLGDKPL